jgi:hypothetical protein
MTFAERNHPVEALLFDRPHEALRVGIRIWRPVWRLHDADPGLAQALANQRAPLRVPITDQHAMADQDPVVRSRERADV